MNSTTFSIRLDKAHRTALDAAARVVERKAGDYIKRLIREDARRLGVWPDPVLTDSHTGSHIGSGKAVRG